MTILRLYFSKHWADYSDPLHWVLLNDKHGLIEEGHASLSSWPKADTYQLVLEASMTLFTKVAIPDRVEQVSADVIRYAVEEQLAVDPAMTYCLSVKSQAREAYVAVVDCTRLQGLVVLLQKKGIEFQCMVPEEALFDEPEAGQATLVRLDNGWMVKSHHFQSYWLPVSKINVLGPLLLHICQTLSPSPVMFEGQEVSAAWLASLQTEEFLHPVAKPNVAQWKVAICPTNLDFSKVVYGRRTAHEVMRRARQGLQLVAGCVTGGTCLILCLALWTAWKKHDYSEQIFALAKSVSLPTNSTDTNTVLADMVADVDKIRVKHGQPGRADALAMLTQFRRVAGDEVQIQSLKYESGRLIVEMVEQIPPALLQRWQSDVAQYQFKLYARASSAAEQHSTLVMVFDPS